MKVYVIEDNPVYNDYVCNLLKKEGFDTMQAYHLSTARKLLAKAEDDDIVLADLRLLDGESIDLLRWMRANGKRQPFIVMTDYAEVHTAVESMKLGSSDYIPKRLVEDKLVPLVRSLHKMQEKKKHSQVPHLHTSRQGIPRNQEACPPCRSHTVERIDTGRERNGQGAYRTAHPRPKQAVGQAVCPGGLRLIVPDAGSIRFLRSQERGFHGC